MNRRIEMNDPTFVYSPQVLVSGPSGMVDSVMAEARKVSWKVFDVESASREF